ncbi:hypothetical protein [Streptacidiphilus carbonis]|uniref:hypothetical protein n=1 Tax=Streptacidiphilus carbonis TaxID=105422 RepID=UPI0005A9443C|nr:hypothetical protein [Streptacidiphilus carbonis]
MALYPRSIQDRFAATVADMLRRLRVLESRTACIDSGFPLAALPAVIDPAYTSGDPSVLINGATTLSGPYQHVAAYTPVASDAVLVLPVGATQTYVILGKLT